MRLILCAVLATLPLLAQQKFSPVDESSFSKVIASNKSKVVLVDFWATYCVPCRTEMPELVKLTAKLKARGFELVTVSMDEPEQQAAALKVLKDNVVPGTLYVKKAADDDKFNALIDAKWSGALPAMFLYDRSGKKVRSFIGETPVKDIEAAIQKLL